MLITNLNSSVIESIDYDQKIETLVVDFKSGTRYAYANVPVSVFHRLITAHSVGKFLSLEIKYKYSFVRLK